MKKITLFLLFALFVMACKKDASSDNHRLSTSDQHLVKIGQEILIYDSTVSHDSSIFLAPPGNRFYVWTVKPDDGTVSFSGAYQKGIGNILFTRAGTYSISAIILDSATQKQVGKTQTVVVTVSTDTLHPFQPVDPNDSLSISAHLLANSQEPILSLGLQTAKKYEYDPVHNGLDLRIFGGDDFLTLVFSDKVLLLNYPLAYGVGTWAQIGSSVFIRLGTNTPRAINITWLDKSYSGTLKIDKNGKVTVDWQNGVVSFH